MIPSINLLKANVALFTQVVDKLPKKHQKIYSDCRGWLADNIVF
jgi:hypothetical protein